MTVHSLMAMVVGARIRLSDFKSFILNFFEDDCYKNEFNLMFNLFPKDLFDQGFIDEISDSIDVNVYIKKEV